MNGFTDIMRWALGSALLAGALLAGAVLAAGDGWSYRHLDEHEEHERHEHRHARQTPVNPVYAEECGTCHIAYPARLLPPQSWAAIMNNLDDHFGENAELIDRPTWLVVSTYLKNRAAPPPRYMLGFGNDEDPPLRITSLAWFRHEHNGIPTALVTGNQEVKSLGNCGACHENAANGVFDEHMVSVPGYGHWDD